MDELGAFAAGIVVALLLTLFIAGGAVNDDGFQHNVGYSQQACMLSDGENRSSTLCVNGKDLLEWLRQRHGIN